MQTTLRVGLCGLGTVAQGVLQVLEHNGELIAGRAGRRIEITRVASRRRRADVNLRGAVFDTDLSALAVADDVDVVVELIGGTDDARTLVAAALGAGKPVVTANKALIAEHGNELHAQADAAATQIRYEAAVAGGIPILGALEGGLAANGFRYLAGIINGTSNYILTAMAQHNRSFADALAEAQRLGYAEADPTFDVSGVDAAHKLCILSSLAFGSPFDFHAVATEGISDITLEDIEYARLLGYRVKHLGIARWTPKGLENRVHPALVPEHQLLASVDGVMNAVLVDGNAAGPTLLYGAGAGALPTASAVISDLMKIARGAPPRQRHAEEFSGYLPISEVETAYYLYIPSLDRPGVFAKVATILSERRISIEGVIQREAAISANDRGAWVPIVLITEKVREQDMLTAIGAVQALEEVVAPIRRIRVESLAHE